MELGEYFIPLDIEAVDLLDVGLLDLLEFRLVSFPNVFDLSFLGQFLKGLYFAFAAFGLHILSCVLILFLFHDEVIALIGEGVTWFSRVC